MMSYLDLRVLRLLIEQVSANSSEEASENALNMNADLSTDVLLLIFIRYLQLIGLMSWSSPGSIAYNSTEVSNKVHLPEIPKFDKLPHRPGLCGLRNIGNTCYMNSAIQCLSQIPQLIEWGNSQQKIESQKTVTQAYISLIQSMWSGQNSCVTPNIIKKRVAQHASIFSDYAHKDSHAFMNSLLNALQSESEGQTSTVTDFFRIQTQSGVTCLHCGTDDSIEETTFCLPLPLGDEPRVSLNSLLNDFIKEEQLDGQYYCSSCQDLREAKQKTSICQPLPPVIIVQLKRFTFDETNEKLDTFVDYPISDWKVNDVLYDLVAVSMHVGNLKGGHYTTYARLNGTDQWYYFNDSEYMPIENTRCIVTRNAYILVYLQKKIDNKSS